MRNFRYRVARFLIHLGIAIMPDGRYKTEMLEGLWGLYFKVQVEVAEARNERGTL